MRIVSALLVIGLAATAHANGRDPYTSTINFQRGNDQHILAGMTFGLVETKDGGQTWNWMCERAVGYGGQYDPDYVYSSTGAVFATTFDGLKVRRDGCSFVSTPPGMTFVSKVEGGPDGAIYYAAADMADSKIYKSSDDGQTFPTSANPGQPGDWWSSLAVAPSNANRVYVTGYRLDGQNPKVFLLYTSTTGGASFTAMTMTGITTVSPNSTIEVVGISPTNDQTVFVKVTFENGSSGDSIYRSTNAGQSWTKILSKSSNFGLSLLVRKNGTATQCIAGTREMGAWVANDCLTATTTTGWTALTNAPHIGCLYADSANNVWACTQNYESPQLGITSDGYGIMKTSDLQTWTGMLKYQDIKAPVPCAAGTVQEDECVQRYMDQQSVWCCLVPQLGITSTAIDCTGALSCFGNGGADGAPDAGTTIKPPGTDPSGCCGTGSGKSSVMMTLLVAAGLLFRRRRPS
jgi:MYXO-CTERM domain-containing protein